MIIASNEEILLEQEIISSIFKDNSLYLKSKEVIKEDMFSINTHKNIYKGIETMLNEKLDVDTVSFIQRFKERLNEFGGITYITEVSNCNPSNVGFNTKLELVVKNYNKRIMLQLKEDIEDGKSIDELTELTEKALESIYSAATTKEIDIDNQYEDYLEEIYSNVKNVGSKSGLRKLDEKLGNFQGGRLITIFARSGIGKTTLALEIAKNMAKQSYKVVYGSGEMSVYEVFSKMASSELEIYNTKFTNKQLEDVEKSNVTEFIGRLNASRLYVTNETNIDKFISEVKLYKLRNGLDVVFVDYVNKYLSNAKGATLTEKIGYISSKLKDLALAENICVVLLAQANRKSDDKQGDLEDKIDESDIQDSARIEQDSDQLIALYRNKKLDNKEVRERLFSEGKLNYNSPNAAENPYCINLMIVKNRHGERGTIACKWDGKYSSVTNFSL